MIVSMMICLVVWNHGMDYDFPETVGNVIIPTDKLFHIFQRGRLKPPTRYALTVFNQHEDGDLMRFEAFFTELHKDGFLKQF